MAAGHVRSYSEILMKLQGKMHPFQYMLEQTRKIQALKHRVGHISKGMWPTFPQAPII